MDERPDEIIGHIEAQRDQLGRNLNELETRVRRTTDWRTYYDRNPMLMMGAALGGGLLLGSVVGSKRSGRSESFSRRTSSHSGVGFASAGVGAAAASSWSQPSASHRSSHAMSQQMNEISRTLEHVKAALISFGIAKAKEFLSQAVPGLDQHLSDAERRHQGHGRQQYGSTGEAQQYADSGAFAQESGGSQPSGATNWEADIYRSSGQFEGSQQASGSSDYYKGNRSSESGQGGEDPRRTPVNQY